LSEEEIKQTAHGYIILDDSCVLALSFTGGVRDGWINDESGKGHHAQVVGSPTFTAGGSP